jgi:hypothetical protein
MSPVTYIKEKRIDACQLEFQMIKGTHNLTFAFKERMTFAAARTLRHARKVFIFGSAFLLIASSSSPRIK